jgi:toxin ParE1/3/4
MKEIRSALEVVGKGPGAGHVREDPAGRPVKFWPVYSYLIVYNPAIKPVQVIRVLHGKRDIEEILN